MQLIAVEPTLPDHVDYLFAESLARNDLVFLPLAELAMPETGETGVWARVCDYTTATGGDGLDIACHVQETGRVVVVRMEPKELVLIRTKD